MSRHWRTFFAYFLFLSSGCTEEIGSVQNADDPAVDVCEAYLHEVSENGELVGYKRVGASIAGDTINLFYELNPEAQSRALTYACRFEAVRDKIQIAIDDSEASQQEACDKEQARMIDWIVEVEKRGGDPKAEVKPEMLASAQRCLDIMKNRSTIMNTHLAATFALSISGANGYPYPLPMDQTKVKVSAPE